MRGLVTLSVPFSRLKLLPPHLARRLYSGWLLVYEDCGNTFIYAYEFVDCRASNPIQCSNVRGSSVLLCK